ncbi:UNVERIFIED_CONTAM: hypothetical protein Slati_1370300 [Sesamum latifolium]|uniref:Uncharacterized protein n=1 Tax=Sesamum latifolium TaxID=2727402 RepID=A0AAW2XIU0_9LAMI
MRKFCTNNTLSTFLYNKKAQRSRRTLNRRESPAVPLLPEVVNQQSQQSPLCSIDHIFFPPMCRGPQNPSLPIPTWPWEPHVSPNSGDASLGV